MSKSPDRRLVVYVTSHGFGHLNRAAAVLNRLSRGIPITIRCNADLFPYWRERLQRPVIFDEYVSDYGAANPPGDSRATDPELTLKRAMAAHRFGMAGLGHQVETLRQEGAGAVLCDVPPLPLVAAAQAGIPGFLLGNFTWADIYEPYARKLGDEAVRFVAELRRCYHHATLLFRAQPALMMRGYRETLDVGLVVTIGRNRKIELHHMLGLSPKDKLVYCYLGRYGQEDLDWNQVAAFGRRGIHFVGFPSGLNAQATSPAAESAAATPPNWHVVSPTEWTGADLAASSDVMIAKAGYGTVSEAMAAGTPLIYPPRSGFAEHRALDASLQHWGGGFRATTREFARFQVEEQLGKALAMRPGPAPYTADGAARVAERLEQSCMSANP